MYEVEKWAFGLPARSQEACSFELVIPAAAGHGSACLDAHTTLKALALPNLESPGMGV